MLGNCSKGGGNLGHIKEKSGRGYTVHIATYRSLRKGYTDLQEQQEGASRELQYKKAGIFVHIQELLKKLYVVKIPEVAFSSTYRSQELVCSGLQEIWRFVPDIGEVKYWYGRKYI